MKLVVQIPCFNEERTLAQTIADVPRRIAGVDEVEILVVDDGSSDATLDVARRAGADHIVRHKRNRGLARAFRTALDNSLRIGADIIVNTDADNQYSGADIPRLIQPILEGEADIVVGDRETHKLDRLSGTNKMLQSVGSRVVRMMSDLDVPDAVSGFRAMSRDAALQLNVLSSFSYTIEMLVQAGQKRLCVRAVPVATNPTTRESRLFSSVPQFIERSATTLLRIYTMYRPLRVFLLLGLALGVVGALPIARFLYAYFTEGGAGHIQSLVLGGVLVMIGIMICVAGIIADLIGFNRQLIESTLEKVRAIELSIENGSARGSQDRPAASIPSRPK